MTSSTSREDAPSWRASPTDGAATTIASVVAAWTLLNSLEPSLASCAAVVALRATSMAPDVAPIKTRDAANATGEYVQPGSAHAAAKARSTSGSALSRNRDTIFPVMTMAGSAPSGMPNSASPNAESVAPIWSLTSGRSPAQPPQNSPQLVAAKINPLVLGRVGGALTKTASTH